MEPHQVRPEDFRQAWPHALALMLKSVEEITAKLQETEGKSQEMIDALPQFVESMGEVLKSAAESQDQLMKKHIGWIDAKMSEMQFTVSRLDNSYKKLIDERALIEAREKRLRKFADLPFLKRLFTNPQSFK